MFALKIHLDGVDKVSVLRILEMRKRIKKHSSSEHFTKNKLMLVRQTAKVNHAGSEVSCCAISSSAVHVYQRTRKCTKQTGFSLVLQCVKERVDPSWIFGAIAEWF